MAGAVPEPELVAAARAGDRDAAGEFFSRHLGYLTAMSRRVAASPDQAEDLLAGAIARLLELWSRGEGPTENVLTYLVASMRNRVIDEGRSPRAREAFVEELPEASLATTPELRRIELRREFGLVRHAFGRLTGDAQHAIREVVVNGRPPREVAPELGRSAGAVSTLVTRAKSSLRRELLVVILREGREECAENAEALPPSVLETPDAHPVGAPGLAHVLGCAECRANWGRYATLTSALGVVPLLSLGLALGPPPAAAVAATGAATGGPTSGADPKPAPAVAAAAGGGAAGVAAGAAAGGAGAVLARVGAVARAALVGPAGIVAVVVALVAGGGLLGAAALGAAGVVELPGSREVPIAAADAPAARLRTTVTPHPEGTVELEVVFEIDAAEWSLVSFSIALPPSVRIAAASAGWSCAGDAGGGVCALDGDVPGVSRFTLAAAGGMPEDGEYLVQVEAIAGDVTTTGYSRGPLPAAEPSPGPSPSPTP